MNNSTYEKLISDFFNEKFKYDILLREISKNISNKKKTNLEKKINKSNNFEITPEYFIIHSKDNKPSKKIKRINNEEINNKLHDVISKKVNNKSLLLQLKNEILYELINLEIGEEQFKKYEEYETFINYYEKKEVELKSIYEKKNKSLQEKEKEIRIKISEKKELLKEETEENERKQYLSDYSSLLKEIEILYEEKNEFSMIEVKNDEDINKEKIIETNLNIINLEEKEDDERINNK